MLVNMSIGEVYVNVIFQARFAVTTSRLFQPEMINIISSIYSETKLMFIQDINNLSGGFMPSQGAFLWSDKLL